MIIAMTGNKGAGKDTAAQWLVKRYGFQEYAFAAPMKIACHVVFGWDERHLFGDLKDVVDPRYGISPRHALQSLGTEWGQFTLSEHDTFGETTGRMLWVKRFIETQYDPGKHWVITDLRFPHEEMGLRAIGATVYVVRVDRDNRTADAHASETELAKVVPDYIVDNDGPQDWLWWQMDQIAREVIHGGRAHHA